MALSAVATALIALYGVNRGLRIWRKQLREKVEFELARKILTSLNRIRSLVSHIRWGGVNGNETPKNDTELLREGEDADVLNDRGERHRREMIYIYQRRTRSLRKETNNLWALIEEAEAFWGHGVRSHQQSLIVHLNKLVIEIERYFSKDPAYQGSERTEARRMIFNYSEENDKYGTELKEKIEAIATIVRNNMPSFKDSGN